MATPKAHTLIDVFLPDGFGAFQFGQGGYGGTFELLNPQWNTVSGTYGFDPIVGASYVQATSTPSYVGASGYDISYDSFFAKVTPAPFGGGNIQTALVVKFDAINYVEMAVGPQGVFSAFGSNNNNIVYPSSAMPAYNPTSHAFWRIRNDGILFHFDTSPDGSTWTELGNVPYSWDATNVTVMFFAGFTGSENSGQNAYISNVNLPGTTLQLSAKTVNTASAWGLGSATVPFSLAARTTNKFNVAAKFTATLGLPEGGLTDFSYSQLASGSTPIDPLITTQTGGYQQPVTVPVSNPVTSWGRTNNTYVVPTAYRDGSYFPVARVALGTYSMTNPETSNNFIANAQMEFTPGFSNRYTANVSNYVNGTYFVPGPGTQTLTRSTTTVLSGQYSGALTSSSSPVSINGGAYNGYYPYPSTVGLIPVRHNGTIYEEFVGYVSLSTTRANTTWYAQLIYYDANFNITNSPTSGVASYSIMTHPGGGVWQTAATIPQFAPTNTAWVAVVPFIANPSNLVETVYISGHSVVGADVYNLDVPTTFNQPNTLNINIKADRVNYVWNGGFNTNINYYSAVNTNTTGSPSPATLSWDGTTGYNSLGSAKMTFVTASGTFSGGSNSQMGFGTPFRLSGGAIPVIQGLKVGHTYTISAWVKQGANCPDVFMNCLDQNFAASGNGVSAVSTNAAKSAGNTVNGWTQISGTFTVPFNGLPDMGLYFYVNYIDYIGAGQNFSFWVDDILLEESTTAGSFFDGNTATNDYLWESGASANAGRSYYYKNYTNKINRLNVALPSVMPLGSTYNLQFAQPITP
jgi:hypothetical protein